VAQERLFRGAVEAIVATAHADFYGRWYIRLGFRRAGDQWTDAVHHEYRLLDSAELCQVLEAVVEFELLGGPLPPAAA
jgi:hypothetical protein